MAERSKRLRRPFSARASGGQRKKKSEASLIQPPGKRTTEGGLSTVGRGRPVIEYHHNSQEVVPKRTFVGGRKKKVRGL